MSDLSTTWLGLTLRSPFVVAASPLSRDPDMVARAVEAGAGAIVMHSLFEEQLTNDQMAAHRFIDSTIDLDAETQGARPGARAFSIDSEPYLRELKRIKERVDVPVIASLNGTTPGGWLRYAKHLEEAGADGIELNLYEVGGPAGESGEVVEARQLEVVGAVVQSVKVPITVKLTPFYSALTSFVGKLEAVGASGVAVFNCFYQPDILLDTLDVDRHLVLSTSADLPLRLRALAHLSAAMSLSLSCTGGVHSGLDAAKAILSGAHVVQLASVLLQHGPQHVAVLRGELDGWLDGKGYKSSAEARGVLDMRSAPDPHAWERLNYTRMLDGWQARDGWRKES